ncbi:FAD-binding protein [Nakamurella sp. YIM 132087]|uniref:FAD-binding protein n=1 Tax=Nakamurella alba TaxID=2665158 RepID=A0A7K1FLC1_9ACTN|nr:FAD-binding protein [Nakamurella alba]
MLDELRGIVGPEHVLTEPDLVAGHLRDWTGRFAAEAGVVVRPADTGQVSAVLAACAAAGTAVLPQGGNTGLVGASVPLHGEIVLHTGRLHGLEVDEVAGQLLAGAGETIGAVHAAAASAGLAYGVDLASRDSCTVGGTVATNAGGLRVLRHGDTRRQVIGVEAVLSDGSVLSHLGGLTRDNTGYHLPSLLAGSEGTLAVLTRVRLRLVPAPGPSAVAVLGLASPADAVVAAGFARRIAGVSAVEFFLPAGLALVREVTGLGAVLPEEHGAYLLLEVDGSAEALVQACEDLPGVQDAAIADDAPGRAALWAYRERHTESIATRGSVIKLDVTLPMATAGEYLDRLPSVVAGLVPDARVWLFGHLADGNVHTNITGVPAADTHRLEDTVLRMVADLGGSIASEHGIGLAKREWLGLGRSEAEIEAFRRIKWALDPAGILHPHAVLGP